jgi:hypothetical protein
MGNGFARKRLCLYLKNPLRQLQGFIMIPPPFRDRPVWLKGRGYLHITPKIDILKRYTEVFTKMMDESYVARHGFFPLIHSVIKERKYKKLPYDRTLRAHSYTIKGRIKKSAKLRPLHYSTHIDAMIFGYYAHLLLTLYEDELGKIDGLSSCITAYRKILINEGEEEDDDTGKGTMHFAYEAFEEIKKRSKESCVVLMYDIKSFFSELNHEKLKKAWSKLIGVEKLNAAHFNVFKAATKFRYILRDDLRTHKKSTGRRSGFDERKLANIRKTTGTEAFFESIADFKGAIESKKIQVYKHPFMKSGRPVGIPQGLPISAVLANLYLLEFDKQILKKIVNKMGGFYRRYSDDILIICKPNEIDDIDRIVKTAIKDRDVIISDEKTETYLFKNFQISPRKRKITSILLSEKSSHIGKPLTYLGFEFYGDKMLIKSANISKFYRRLIYSVKRKSLRATKISSSTSATPFIFRGQLTKRYSAINLDKEKKNIEKEKKKTIRTKSLVKNPDGTYSYEFEEKPRKYNSNYFSYVRKAVEIMNQPEINHQLRNHKKILNQAVFRHFGKQK